MAEKLTPQQQMVVNNRGGKLLVSAAAGSGKTKVLVDRLLSYITSSNGTINIDDFLIITFTQAAASELRSKIAEKLNERLSEDPGNRHLQRQIQRLYMAKISTVHAFCAEILREYAYRLDIPGDFRMADERECNAIKNQVLDKILETAYEEANEDFLFFMDSQELDRTDNSIPQLILKVYKSAWCHIDPQAWLDRCLCSGNVDQVEDVSQLELGSYLIDDFHQFMEWQIQAIENCAILAEQDGSMPKVAALMRETVNRLSMLRQFDRWDDIVNHQTIDFGRLEKPKDCLDPDLFEKIKLVRNNAKDAINKKITIFSDLSAQVLRDLNSCSVSMKGLIGLVNRFSQEYTAAKNARRVLDFGDLEHRMLDLLLGKKRQGYTAAAEEIGRRFVEIMVDEYQDTNAVQDAIFSALTHKQNNLFMVGDVKQSIYQFRLADPSIFLQKYQSYAPAERAEPGQGRKVMLSSNFRSAGSVIHAVNDVFSNCMSETVGGLVYDQDVQLYEGIPHISIPEPEVEFCAIDVQKDTYAEEAEYVASRIEELLDGTHYVRCGDSLRPIVADDIVILLRAPKSSGAEFQYALASHNIRATSESGVDLLQTEEISFIRAMLQIIYNPLQDIPLITALTSKVLCFTADDLAGIRAANPRSLFFDSLQASQELKAKNFLEKFQLLRDYAKLATVSQLVDKILSLTRLDAIYSAFEDGQVRKANLQTFYQLVQSCEATNVTELGQFLDYLDTLDEEGLTPPSDQNVPGAVSILSIHKSKGLEYPVVFLCGLSREFNFRHLNEQVLCNQDLGIGLNCLDLKNRVRYPSVAKKAIRIKMRKETVSEEIRLLYVAMTRARDRLIMTYADNKLSNTVSSLALQMDICSKDYMMSSVIRPGIWVMMSALRRTEAGALFAIGDRPDQVFVSDDPWSIKVERVATDENDEKMIVLQDAAKPRLVDTQILSKSLKYEYPHKKATSFPSKQTATQIKGRYKDFEAAENAEPAKPHCCVWRDASFDSDSVPTAVSFGNAVHTVMQYISFKECISVSNIENEIERIVNSGYITTELAAMIDANMLMRFFETELGCKLRKAENILREFKFSVLDRASHYDEGMENDHVLLQGVVDCAILESDGICVIDFKTDRVTEETVEQTADQYRAQVLAYAEALSRIYGLPVKSADLYFFRTGSVVNVI